MALENEAEQVFTQDSVSGQVAFVPRVYLTLFPNLTEVPVGTKPKAAHMHKERPAKETKDDATASDTVN